MAACEKYGVDAPGIVRSLSLVGIILIACSFLPNDILGASILRKFLPTGISALAIAVWMLASSLWIKKRVMHSLLDQRHWRGDETVLDVGCGRGLIAIEAARRVPKGRVHAVDLWQPSDLSGNSPEGIRTNAVCAGVESRLGIETGDARALPYCDASFDVVCTMTAIHNIEGKEGRCQAIAEVWRVLRPGGQILIFDIRHAKSYLHQLRDLGAIDTAVSGPIVMWGQIGWSFRAMKLPTEY